MSSTTVIVLAPFRFAWARPLPSSLKISSAPSIVILAPVVKPCATCVTFTTPEPCFVAKGSSSNSILTSFFNVPVTVVAFVYPVIDISDPW